ncbi:MAG: hypothetical protein GX777_09325 [Fastidiosipila sp.]|nr:hypothetical protein [Fastidiosipila sp.]
MKRLSFRRSRSLSNLSITKLVHFERFGLLARSAAQLKAQVQISRYEKTLVYQVVDAFLAAGHVINFILVIE